MNLQDCIAFARENPMCFLATVDGNQPHVRTLYMDQADETGFYFTTGTTKQVYQQIKANPRVEICFYNHAADFGQARQLRITGQLEEVNDPAMLEKGYAARQGLEPLVGKPLKPLLVAYRLSKGVAHFWTLMNAFKEDAIEKLQF
jgi:pyridoxamine 5'-phosphate oxidase